MSRFDRSSPDWLYLVVTAADDVVTRLDGARHVVELKADAAADVETVADLRRYLRDAMAPRIDRISLDGALAQLANNAAANFLCAKFLKVINNNNNNNSRLNSFSRDCRTESPRGVVRQRQRGRTDADLSQN